jgi:hypothetical protein
MVEGLRFEVQGVAFIFWRSNLQFGVWSLEFEVESLEFRVWSLEFGV